MKTLSSLFTALNRRNGLSIMRTTLAFNGSYFNTNRMVKQYIRNAYYPVKLIETTKVEESAPSYAMK